MSRFAPEFRWIPALVLGAALSGGCGRVGYDSVREEPSGVKSGAGGTDAAAGATSTGGTTSTGAATGTGGMTNTGGAAGAGGGAGTDAGTTGGATGTGGTIVDGSIGGGGTTATGGAPGTDAGSCTSATYGGHEYVFCPNVLAFDDAAADCQARSMRLARIDDAAENQFLASVAFAATGTQNRPNMWPWFGARSSATPIQWSFVDGTVFWSGVSDGSPVGGLYSNWSSANPADPTGTFCATLSHSGGLTWVDRGCVNVQPYLCEAY